MYYTRVLLSYEHLQLYFSVIASVDPLIVKQSPTTIMEYYCISMIKGEWLTTKCKLGHYLLPIA